MEDFDPQKYVYEKTEDNDDFILKNEIKGKITFNPEDWPLNREIIQHLKEITEDFKNRGFTITYRVNYEPIGGLHIITLNMPLNFNFFI